MTTLQNIAATYAVSIVPGAAQKSNLIHYYPPAIAVPIGTTVAWFNNDQEQPPTVTSGLPGASDSGALFNSGVMPATANSFNIHSTKQSILHIIVRCIHGELHSKSKAKTTHKSRR
jgi:hypothetical protein